MCSIALATQEPAMTTTQLIRTEPNAVCMPWQGEERAERGELQMNWVVVIDERGEARLRIHWTVGERDA